METNNLFYLCISSKMAYKVSLTLLYYIVIQMAWRLCFRTVWYIADIQMFLLCSSECHSDIAIKDTQIQSSILNEEKNIFPSFFRGKKLNHRITEWLPLEATSGNHMETPSAKQSHLELVTQDCIQMSFEYLREPRLICSGQSVRVLYHPPGNDFQVQKDNPMQKWHHTLSYNEI